MERFPWGKILDRHQIALDGGEVEIIEYHPYIGGGIERTVDTNKIMYHCEAIRRASLSLDALILYIIAQRRLGDNQHVLVGGLLRMFGITED
jgi:hypothetical protein